MNDGRDSGRAFIEASREYLSRNYLPKIRRCLDRLPAEDLFWRPNEASNSVGNLCLHLAGNVRQWIVAGVGGAPDTRRRGEEFAARGGASADELLEHLEAAVAEVDEVLDRLPVEALGERRTIQGREVTVLQAVYHVVEHFAMHTGQIIYMTKLRTGEDLAFWTVRDGKAEPNW